MHWLVYQISCCVVWWSGKWTAIGEFFREYAINDDLSPVFLANYGLDINLGGLLG